MHEAATKEDMLERFEEASVRALTDVERPDHFTEAHGSMFAGKHLLVDVIEGSGLDDEALIRETLLTCVEKAGATLLHVHTHRFSPQGVSGVAVLAESHISVHTWPEIGYGAFDVFMCGDADPWKAIDVLRDAFGAKDVIVREFRRGEGLMSAPE